MLLAVGRPRCADAAGHGAPVAAGSVLWLACIVLCALAVGLGLGAARVRAIDAGALEAPSGTRLTVEGHVAAVPRREDGEVRVRVETAAGRLLVEAPEPVPDLPVGVGVRATGSSRAPGDWERALLERQGIGAVLRVRTMTLTETPRGGILGTLDAVRARAQAALARGTTPAATDLLRGFVLGEDDRIDATTVDEFKRSGLAHLLAVSGQNVLLLALLAGAVLAVLGVPLRARLAWILVAIAVYVPVAGAGPSIQRAGIAGAAAVVAALAGRPRSRWYALLLAAAGTLALNPRSTADVAWQLSFAAVIGILLFAAPLRAVLAGRSRGPRGALAEGAALTVAATLATAPLMAHHFGTASLVALPANAVALPAVAPVMWLGMLAGALGQLPWIPVEPLTWLAGALAGYIAQVAAWFAAPSWSMVDARLPSALAVAAALTAVGGGLAVMLRWAGRRRDLSPRIRVRDGSTQRGSRALLAIAALAVVAAGVAAFAVPAGPRPGTGAALRIRFLDVGQGDAILLEPAGSAPVLIDAGPEEAQVAERLQSAGVDRLAAVIVTHPDSDHAGGVPAVLTGLAVRRLIFAQADRASAGAARAARVRLLRVSAGDRLRAGPLRLEVLWPPPARLAASLRAPGEMAGEPNDASIVLRLRWRRFDALLAGDAEAEVAPVRSGPVELFKVAHHGSTDAGLAALLARARPRVAVISVGAGNPYGHPAPQTIAELAEAGARVLRTDERGDVIVEVAGGGWRVR